MSEIITIGNRRFLHYETTFITLTAPEGIDLWNTGDEDSVKTLKRLEDILSMAQTEKWVGAVLPYGYKFVAHTIRHEIELPGESGGDGKEKEIEFQQHIEEVSNSMEAYH